MNKNITTFSHWNNKNAFRRNYGTTLPKSYPDETLVRILNSKSYSKLTSKLFKQRTFKNVCDVGCMSGSNLRLFLDMGFKTFGIDVNKKMLDIGKKNLKRLGYNIDLTKKNFNTPIFKIGNNLEIPFEKNFFDLLISFGTIHYNYDNDIIKSLEEFKRVTKKNGIIIIETTGNTHDIKKNAKKLKNLKWICKNKGFRKNQIFGWFESAAHFKRVLNKIFTSVEILENKNFTEHTKLHSLIAICKV